MLEVLVILGTILYFTSTILGITSIIIFTLAAKMPAGPSKVDNLSRASMFAFITAVGFAFGSSLFTILPIFAGK